MKKNAIKKYRSETTGKNLQLSSNVTDKDITMLSQSSMNQSEDAMLEFSLINQSSTDTVLELSETNRSSEDTTTRISYKFD